MKKLELKKEVVSKIKKKIDDSRVVILTDYKGMSVKEITILKKKLRKSNAEFKVVKNTISVRALDGKLLEPLRKSLEGPTAIVLGYDDPIGPVKALYDFIGEIEKPLVKGGIFEGAYATTDEIKAISKLPSREVLLAKVVCGMKSPITGLVFTLKGITSKLVYALNAIKDKKGGDQK